MIVEKLKKYSANDKLSLVIRHGDRNQIPLGSSGVEVMLNDDGLKNSMLFGESLSNFKVNKILTSPIKRCIQTAESIAKGYGSEIEIIETKCLGAPGLHIYDERKVGKFFRKYGFDELYYRYVNEMEIPGIPSIDQINGLISTFITQNTSEPGLTIFITHDMLIALYHYSISKKIYTKENWINYLSGLIFKDGVFES